MTQITPPVENPREALRALFRAHGRNVTREQALEQCMSVFNQAADFQLRRMETALLTGPHAEDVDYVDEALAAARAEMERCRAELVSQVNRALDEWAQPAQGEGG